MWNSRPKPDTTQPARAAMTEYNVVRLRGIVDGEQQEIPLESRGTLTKFRLRTGSGTRWETIYTISVIGDRKAFIAGIGEGDEIDCTCWLNSRESSYNAGKYYLSLSLREIAQTRPVGTATAPKPETADDTECPGTKSSGTATAEKESCWGADDSDLPF